MTTININGREIPLDTALHRARIRKLIGKKDVRSMTDDELKRYQEDVAALRVAALERKATFEKKVIEFR